MSKKNNKQQGKSHKKILATLTLTLITSTAFASPNINGNIDYWIKMYAINKDNANKAAKYLQDEIQPLMKSELMKDAVEELAKSVFSTRTRIINEIFTIL